MYSVRDFFEHCNKNLEQVTAEDVEQYLYSLMDKGMSRSSILRHFSAIKRFFRDFRPNLNLDVIELPAPEHEFPLLPAIKILTEEQTRMIIHSAPNLKVKAMLILGYDAALRASELCSLRVRDVDLDEWVVYVTPAKKRVKTVYAIPIGEEMPGVLEQGETIDVLTEYINSENLEDDDWLFPSKRGRAMDPNYFSRDIFGRLVRSLGLHGVRYHDFSRHTRACHLLKKYADIYTVYKIMRHSRIETTMKYEHLVPEDVRKRLRMMKKFKNEEI